MQARLLGERDEAVRPDETELRVVPAHERLDAADAAARQRDLRLVVHDELAALDARGAAARRARGGRGSARRARARRSRCVVRVSFAPVQRLSACLSSSSAPAPCSGKRRCRCAPDVERQRRRPSNGSSSARSTPRRGHLRAASPSAQQHRELVAAETREHSPGAAHRCRRAARRRSSWSPCAWPSVSLTALKSSRSRMSTTTCESAAAHPVQCGDQPIAQQRAVRQVGQQVVRRPVATGRRLAAAEVDREHRHEAERDERDARARRAHHDRSHREHEPARDDVERKVLEQVARRGLTIEHRAPGSGQHLVGGEEGDRAGRDRRQRPGTHVDGGGRTRELQGDACGTDRQDVLRRVEHEVRRAGAEHEIRQDRRHGVHGHGGRHAEDEQDRDRVRGRHRHVVVPVTAGHRQRQQLADEDEQREQPERDIAGGRRPCGARRDGRQGRRAPRRSSAPCSAGS